MSWEIEKMNGIELCNKTGHIPIEQDEIYPTTRGDFIDIDVELIKFTCPKCKEEKLNLFINGYIQYGGSSCFVIKGVESYSCGCSDFEDLKGV